MAYNITNPLALNDSEATAKNAMMLLKSAFLNNNSTPDIYMDMRTQINIINSYFGFSQLSNKASQTDVLANVNKLIDLEQSLDVSRFLVDISDGIQKPYAARADFRMDRYLQTGVAVGSITPASVSSLVNPAIDTFSNMFTYSRLSTGTYVDANGVIQTAAAGVQRYTYQNGFRQLLVESSSTNLIRNNMCVGAVVGTPGTPPNLHFYTSSKDGLQVSIAGLGTIQGMPYVDYRTQGTTTATGQIDYLSFDSNISGITFNDNITYSAYVALVGGSFNNTTSAVFSASQANTTGSYISEVTNQQNLKTSGLTSNLTRIVQTGVANNPAVASVKARTQIAYNIGSTIDITLRFAGAQLEKFGAPSSLIFTKGSTITRTADLPYLSTKMVEVLNRGNATVILKGRVNGSVGANNYNILNADNMVFFKQASSDPSALNGGTQISPLISSLGSPTGKLTGQFATGLSYAPNIRVLTAQGNSLQTDANNLSLGIQWASLGTGTAGSPGFLCVDEVLVYPFQATNASLQAKTVVYA